MIHVHHELATSSLPPNRTCNFHRIRLSAFCYEYYWIFLRNSLRLFQIFLNVSSYDTRGILGFVSCLDWTWFFFFYAQQLISCCAFFKKKKHKKIESGYLFLMCLTWCISIFSFELQIRQLSQKFSSVPVQYCKWWYIPHWHASWGVSSVIILCVEPHYRFVLGC